MSTVAKIVATCPCGAVITVAPKEGLSTPALFDLARGWFDGHTCGDPNLMPPKRDTEERKRP